MVSHSYGGVVVTQAGNDAKVAGLVYFAAFATDAGQSIIDVSAAFPKPLVLDKLVPQPDGFLDAGARGVCGYALCRAASSFDSKTLPFDGRLIVGEAAGIDRKGQFNEIDRFAK